MYFEPIFFYACIKRTSILRYLIWCIVYIGYAWADSLWGEKCYAFSGHDLLPWQLDQFLLFHCLFLQFFFAKFLIKMSNSE